jgi:hypothetical protein
VSAVLAVTEEQQPTDSIPEHVSSASLERRFPGWVVWRGQATGSWWAAPPRGLVGRLVEAADPAELAATIRATRKGGGQVRRGSQQ